MSSFAMFYQVCVNPVDQVYVGMTGTTILLDFVVLSKAKSGWLVENTSTCVFLGMGKKWNEVMSTEDILRLCDDNKGKWV